MRLSPFCSRLFGLLVADQSVWNNRNMPRNGAPTRDRILRVAERLMTDQGYNATSVDQIIAESSSSKGAFFHHFSSKADLAVHLVERYVKADIGQLHAGLAAVDGIEDPAARVVAFLRF